MIQTNRHRSRCWQPGLESICISHWDLDRAASDIANDTASRLFSVVVGRIYINQIDLFDARLSRPKCQKTRRNNRSPTTTTFILGKKFRHSPLSIAAVSSREASRTVDRNHQAERSPSQEQSPATNGRAKSETPAPRQAESSCPF